MRIVMPEIRRKFDPEFREGAVRIVRETGRPIAQIARELGINSGTLGNWVAKDQAERDGGAGRSADDAAELKRLRGEVAELRMERDVLKCSVVLWVKEATSERGTLHRRPEDEVSGAAHDHLHDFGLSEVVLKVDQGAGHRSWLMLRRPRRRGASVVRGLGTDLRFPAVAPRSARGRLGSEREQRRRLDAGKPVRPQTQAAPRVDQTGPGRTEVRGPAAPRLLRPDPEPQVVRGKTQTATGEGKLYLATVIDLYSRRLLACPISEHPNAELAGDAIKIAAATRGGRSAIDGVIFHTADRGSTYTATSFTTLCFDRLGVVQSMGRVGSCFDNAAAESFFSTLEHEVLSRHRFNSKTEAREVIKAWCHGFYNTRRRHSSAALLPPAEFEKITADQPAAA